MTIIKMIDGDGALYMDAINLFAQDENMVSKLGASRELSQKDRKSCLGKRPCSGVPL